MLIFFVDIVLKNNLLQALHIPTRERASFENFETFLEIFFFYLSVSEMINCLMDISAHVLQPLSGTACWTRQL